MFVRILFVLLATASFAVAFYRSGRVNVSTSDVLRISFRNHHAARFYEPARIRLAPEYIFLENVFSPLIEMDPVSGQLVGGLAERWIIEGDELRLIMRSGIKTIDGHVVTAEDAELSLKRLFILKAETQGNLKEIVCGKTLIKSVRDTCAGIRIDHGDLVLKVGDKAQFILPLLSAIDFAVIPKGSYHPQSLEITDYRNSSGPYFVSQDSEIGRLELSANPFHYHYSPKIAQKVQFIPSKPGGTDSTAELFQRGEVDHVTTVDYMESSDIISLARSLPKSTLHKTANFRMFCLFFSERGLKELTQDERLVLGQTISQALSEHFPAEAGYEKSQQLFPPLSDGALSESEATKIRNRRAKVGTPVRKILLHIVRSGRFTDLEKSIRAAAPETVVLNGKTAPSFDKTLSTNELPHAWMSGPDVSFGEDISLLSYALHAGMIYMPQNEISNWLARYMERPDKEARMALLRNLHRTALERVTLYPMFSGPYTAVVQNGWQSHLPVIFANNPLWLIRRN